MDSIDDIAPNVRGVVAVQVDYLLMLLLHQPFVRVEVFVALVNHFNLAEINRVLSGRRWRWRTVARDLIEIILVCFRSNDVDYLVERHLRL